MHSNTVTSDDERCVDGEPAVEQMVQTVVNQVHSAWQEVNHGIYSAKERQRQTAVAVRQTTRTVSETMFSMHPRAYTCTQTPNLPLACNTDKLTCLALLGQCAHVASQRQFLCERVFSEMKEPYSIAGGSIPQ